MQKLFTIAFLLFSFTTTFAQFSFSDDFESYALGNYIGEADTLWTTWSGTTGGTEDVQTTMANAYSGSQSIYFSSSSANGGPQDVVLPFGEVFDQGDFDFSSRFFVNGGAYFNFQAETTIGNTWAVDCNMNSDGTIVFSTGGGGTVFLSSTYPSEEWFKLDVKINLTLNKWEVFINDNSIGSFSNTVNEVASLDLFPLNGHSFYVDDVMVSHQPFNPIGINAILTDLSIPSYIQIPADVDIEGSILNYGADTITSMDIVWTDGTNSLTDNVSGISIPTLGTYDFTHADQLSMTTLDTANISVTIENINGGSDVDTSNNSIDFTIISVEFVTQRIPLFEHFTSNTCGPCASFNPGFQTLLDANNVNELSNAKVGAIKYQVNWPGSADQSFNADVASRVSYYNVQGVPSAHIDGISTSSSQDEIDEHAAAPSFIKIEGTAVATDGTDLDIELTVTSYVDYPNASIHIAVVEDEYNNTAGTNGESEFFQVLRKMLPDGDGTTADLSNGNSVTVNESAIFAVGNVTADSYRLWNGLGNCRVVAFVQDEDSKQVIDARIIEITGDLEVTPSWECVSNACVDPGTGEGEYSSLADCETQCVTTSISAWEDINVQLMPNPAMDNLSISINPSSQALNLSILSMTGQKVFEKNYGILDDEQLLTLDISDLSTGFYTLKVQLNDKTSIHRFIKQ
ncbi:MAG: T9SS type A sorting domain-containing protein [Flavobacteriales bacterium]|nr:T9SS type A sorting domain-containing protein [Flavobacteriales bacterium]